jgi:hypothetical protein
MKTVAIKVYQFDELSDDAKEEARTWFRDGALDYEWWDSIYGDAKEVGLIISEFGLDYNRHATGGVLDGAEECAHKIVDNHGSDCETYKTATAYLADRDRIIDQAPKDDNGDFDNEWELDSILDECDHDFIRTILEDYSIMLQHEYKYLLSDEAVDESIRANEYEFTENGKRF